MPARTERKAIVEHHLALVGLAESMHDRSRDLSQGMQQRVGIARAFALSPKMLLLDEPFGMLDSLTRMELQEVLLELLARDQKTTLMVTHDVDEALFMSDRVVMMTTGPRAHRRHSGSAIRAARVRTDVLEHHDYYTLRERLIGFLEGQAYRPEASDQRTDFAKSLSH